MSGVDTSVVVCRKNRMLDIEPRPLRFFNTSLKHICRGLFVLFTCRVRSLYYSLLGQNVLTLVLYSVMGDYYMWPWCSGWNIGLLYHAFDTHYRHKIIWLLSSVKQRKPSRSYCSEHIIQWLNKASVSWQLTMDALKHYS